MTTRRGFLQACLAAAAAPYVVTSAGVLMPIKQRIVMPEVLAEPYSRFVFRWVPDTKIATYLAAGWKKSGWKNNLPGATVELLRISEEVCIDKSLPFFKAYKL